MRAKKTAIALAAVLGLTGNLSTQAFAQAKPLPQPESEILRVDHVFMSLFKLPPDRTIDDVVQLYDGAVIVAKCYTVDSCLKARKIVEPLAELSIDGVFSIAIIEAADETPSGYLDIEYTFGDNRCGTEFAFGDYTTMGLLEAAKHWAARLPPACKGE